MKKVNLENRKREMQKMNYLKILHTIIVYFSEGRANAKMGDVRSGMGDRRPSRRRLSVRRPGMGEEQAERDRPDPARSERRRRSHVMNLSVRRVSIAL